MLQSSAAMYLGAFEST